VHTGGRDLPRASATLSAAPSAAQGERRNEGAACPAVGSDGRVGELPIVGDYLKLFSITQTTPSWSNHLTHLTYF
jgi:hypothetical protein